MKILVFTALAVVAFSGAGMAKTKKKCNWAVSNLGSNTNKIILGDCGVFANKMTDAMEEIYGCFTGTEYNAIYWYWYGSCTIKK